MIQQENIVELKDILEDTLIKENISEMIQKFKEEPQVEYHEKYKKLKIDYYRDSLFGTWKAYITVPRHFYIYNIKNRQKELKIPVKQILSNFKEITYFMARKPDSIARNDYVFGITTNCLSPLLHQEQLLKLTQAFPDYLTKEEKIIPLHKLKYVTLKEVKKTTHKIVNFIEDKCTAQEIKQTKCAICKKTIPFKNHRLDKKKRIVCEECGRYDKENRFINKSKLKKGKFYTRKINNKIYYACHVCGMLTKNLFTHSTTKHNINRDEYSKLYDIDFTLPRSKGGYYENTNIYHSSRPGRKTRRTTNTENKQD